MNQAISPIHSARVSRNRKGVIFVAALGVTVVLAGLLLVFAQEMRVEAIASAARLADIQAAAVETAAEQWVMAQLEDETDAVIIRDLNSEGLRVGNSTTSGGYFWIIRADPDSATNYAFGIGDEASKLNINTATVEQLEKLPGITTEIASSIVEWRGGTTTTGGAGGAGSTYYSTLAEPYSVKNGNFESVEELSLIKDVTPALLWGRDRNHDGVIDDAENAALGGSATAGVTSSGVQDDGRGIAQYLTAWSASATTNTGAGGGAAGGGGAGAGGGAAGGGAGAGGGGAGSGGAGGGAGAGAGGGAAGGGSGSGSGSGSGTTATSNLGKINANTASRNVLIASGMSGTQADSVISARASTGSQTGTAWISTAAQGADITNYVADSQQFTADIVAVSADGRAFRRARIVVETRSTPHQIIYRKDLTHLGWPLPREIRESLRAGRGLEGSVSR